MTGIWLDNKKNPPAANPYNNSANVLGTADYVGGIGIIAEYGPYTVTNSGTITAGANTVGGIVLLMGGSVTNQTGGVISGGIIGVDFEGAGPVVNNGTITGMYAVVARSSGTVTNGSTGHITGTADGIFVGQQNYTPPIYGNGSTGSVVNQGFVTATGAGVKANGVVLNVAAGYVKNSGTIISIAASSNRSGLGVAENYGGTMVNSGSLRGGYAGFSAGGNPVNKGPATVTNTSTGIINGGNYGVRLISGGSVQNNGSIGSDNSFAIFLQTGGTVNNTGTINGYSGGINSAGTVTITNAALISPTGKYANAVVIKGGTLTNNKGATILGKGAGVAGSAGAAGPALTIINAGTIGSNGISVSDGGITLTGPGTDSITNQSTGFVYGPTAGVGLLNGGTLLNQGTIRAQGLVNKGTGLRIFARSTITNASGGTISGAVADVAMTSASQSSFVNYGVINGTGTAGNGVALSSIAGTLTNGAGGYISGTSYGVIDSLAPLTLVNAGTIGGGTKAVLLAAGSLNQLQVAPGAVFNGKVDGGNVIGVNGFQSSNLLMASAGTTGVLNSLGGAIYNFATIGFAPGASWKVVGSTGGFTGGETFSGFAPGDTLQLNGVTNETVAGFAANTLTLTGDATLDIIIPGNFDASRFHVSNVGINSVAVSVSCFAPGTGIRMAAGEDVPIEALRPGMRVLTAENVAAEIVWVGHRHIDCRRHPRPEMAYPVRVRAGAFGPGVPARDLRLSPDHAVFARDVLIPVRCLINGATILQEPVEAITWFHLELPEHEVILAENLPVESYLDTGDRGRRPGMPLTWLARNWAEGPGTEQELRDTS